MIKECSFLRKGALCNIDVEWFFQSHIPDNRLSLNQAKKHRWKRQKSSWSVWIWLNNFLYFIAGFISGLTGHSSVSRAFLLAVDRPLWSRRQRKFSGSWFASSNSLCLRKYGQKQSAPSLISFPFFRRYFFSDELRSFRSSRILVKMVSFVSFSPFTHALCD